MRKITAVVFALLLLASPSFAAVGIKVNGTPQGTATDLNFQGGNGTMESDGSTFTFPLVNAGVDTGGISSVLESTADISATGFSLVFKDIPAGTQSGLLTGGIPGQIITIQIGVDGGGLYIMSASAKSGWTALSFDDADDRATLLYINSTLGWIVLNTDGVALQ